MADSRSIYLLPHYRRRAEEVFFLGEPTAVLRLAPDELGRFDALAESHEDRELDADTRRFGERLCALGMAVACPPLPRSVGRHVLVVEPHMDDAVLSNGGALLLRRGMSRATVLTVVRDSDYTKLAPAGDTVFGPAGVSALRLAESRLAARLVGFAHETLDETDFPLKLRREQRVPPERSMNELRVSFKRFAPSAAATAALAAKIYARVEALAPDEIWIPLGVGENPDHVRVSRACLHMLHDHPELVATQSVSFYEDLAPFPLFAGHIERVLAVHAKTGELHTVVEDVTTVFDELVRALSIYASQVDMGPSPRPMSSLGDLLALHAADAQGSARRLERRYEIVRTPQMPSPSAVWLRARDLVAALEALAPWIRRRGEVRRLAVLGTTSFGDWRRAMRAVLRIFSNASIEVFTTAAHEWETSPILGVEVVVCTEQEMASRLPALGAHHVLVAGPGSFVSDTADAPAHCAIVATLGDAITALEELVPEPRLDV